MPVFSGSDIAKTAKILIAVAADPTGLSVVGGGLDAVLLYFDKTAKNHPDIKQLEKELSEALKARLANPNFHRPDGSEVHLPQMIEKALLAPGDFIQCNLDPSKIIDLMITRLSEAEHKAAAMVAAFRALYLPLLTDLINDQRLIAVINPAIQRKLLERSAAIEINFDHLKRAKAATAEELGLTKGLFISLARRVATEVDDIDTAYKEIERAIDTAVDLKRSATLPSNLGDAVDAVLRRMAELNAAGGTGRGGGGGGPCAGGGGGGRRGAGGAQGGVAGGRR